MAIIASDPVYFGGRLIGCYVYMMLCTDGDNVHIKIGMSQDPGKRALALYNNSPLKIETMAVVDLPSRRMALDLERDLHKAFEKHRTNGEWFRFANAERQVFNLVQQGVLAGYESPSKKLRWTKINVAQLAKDARARLNTARRRWNSLGLAHRDALQAGLCSK